MTHLSYPEGVTYPLTLASIAWYLDLFTDDDIIGVTCETTDCLVARTLDRLYPHDGWSVGPETYSTLHSPYAGKIPPAVRQLIRLFDDLYPLQLDPCNYAEGVVVRKGQFLTHLKQHAPDLLEQLEASYA